MRQCERTACLHSGESLSMYGLFRRCAAFAILAVLAGPDFPVQCASPPGAAEESQQAAKTVKETGSQPEPESWMLRYRFQEKDLLYFRRQSRSTLRVSARDVTQMLRESRDTYKHFRVVSVDDEGTAVLEPVIDRTIMQARSDDGEPIVWDSRSTQPVPKRFQVVAGNVGRPVVRVRYRTNGKVEEVLPVDRTQQPLGQDLSAYGFLVRLPDDAVSAGESWNDDFDVQVSAEPQLSRKLHKAIPIRRVYTLKNVEENIALIAFRTFVQKPVRDPIIEAQLISRSLAGTVKFDIRRGLILEWASAGSGEVYNPYGSSSSLQSSLNSVERYLQTDQAPLKPVLSVSGRRNSPRPNTPAVALPPGRRRL